MTATNTNHLEDFISGKEPELEETCSKCLQFVMASHSIDQGCCTQEQSDHFGHYLSEDHPFCYWRKNLCPTNQPKIEEKS
jgi:hypothetical protein